MVFSDGAEGKKANLASPGVSINFALNFGVIEVKPPSSRSKSVCMTRTNEDTQLTPVLLYTGVALR